MLQKLLKELQKAGSPEQVNILQKFFKTGKGEYGEGDVFLGIKSQQIKDIAKKYHGLSLSKIKELLKSKVHENRICALRILDRKYKKASEGEKEKYF